MRGVQPLPCRGRRAAVTMVVRSRNRFGGASRGFGRTSVRWRNQAREHVCFGSMDVFAFPVLEASALCDNDSVLLRSEGATSHHHIPLLFPFRRRLQTLNAEPRMLPTPRALLAFWVRAGDIMPWRLWFRLLLAGPGLLGTLNAMLLTQATTQPTTTSAEEATKLAKVSTFLSCSCLGVPIWWWQKNAMAGLICPRAMGSMGRVGGWRC